MPDCARCASENLTRAAIPAGYLRPVPTRPARPIETELGRFGVGVAAVGAGRQGVWNYGPSRMG